MISNTSQITCNMLVCLKPLESASDDGSPNKGPVMRKALCEESLMQITTTVLFYQLHVQ